MGVGGNDKPHVLIIVQNMPVPLDRRVWLECRALFEAGYRVSVICPKGPGDPAFAELEGIRLHKYRPAPPTAGFLSFAYEFAYCWIRTALLATRIHRRERLDVIQACNPPDTYFVLAACFKLFGVRFVYDQHDPSPEVFRSRFPNREGGLLHRTLLLMEAATYRLADHVIVTNDSFRQMAIDRGGQTREGTTVVRSGPIASVMRRGDMDTSVREGRRYLCCWLGIMGPQDGVDLLLDVVARLVQKRERTDCQFALMGYGDCLDDLKQQAAELGIEEYVTFTGRVGDDEIHRYFSTANVGLSTDPKNAMNDLCTMNKVLEYMAYELPIVSFDLKETRVSAQDAAIYVASGDLDSYADAIELLLDDEGEARRRGHAGRMRLERELSWEHSGPAYVGVFDRLLKN